MSVFHCEIDSPEAGNAVYDARSVWLQPAWMNGFAELYDIKPRILYCFKEGNPVAILPFYEKRKLGFNKAYNPVLVYYSPVHLHLPDKKYPNHNLLLQYDIFQNMGDFLQANYKRVALNLNTQVYDIRAWKTAGFAVQPVYTFIQTLAAPVEFFQTEQRALRKSQNLGYSFDCNFVPDKLLELVYGMYERKKIPFNVPRNKHLTLLKTLHKAGLIEQYNVLKSGEIVSSMLIITSGGDTAFAWQTATNEEDMKSGAGLLMFWEVFQALKHRYTYLDLCGGNSGGPSRLKAALGAVLTLFFQITK